jgi:hypothetical protein
MACLETAVFHVHAVAEPNATAPRRDTHLGGHCGRCIGGHACHRSVGKFGFFRVKAKIDHHQ